MIEATLLNGIPGTVAYFDAEGVPCEKDKAVRGEVTLETGEHILVTFKQLRDEIT